MEPTPCSTRPISASRTIAAEGNYDNTSIPQPNNADTIAISRMDTDGLNSTPLVYGDAGRHL